MSFATGVCTNFKTRLHKPGAFVTGTLCGIKLTTSGLILAGVPLIIMGVIGTMLLIQGDATSARSTFAVGVIIAATGGASVIYQVERWKLRIQSLIHFAVMLCTVLPALYLGGWFTLNEPIDYLSVLGIFLVTGVVLWLVFYLIFGVIQPKMQAKRIRS